MTQSDNLPPRMNYLLLTSVNKDELNRKVSQALDEGYRLSGSPVVNTSSNKNVYFAQAVVLPQFLS